MIEEHSVEVGGTIIEYKVIRSEKRKKTIQVSVDRRTGVLVRAPAVTPADEIRDLMIERAHWIAERQAIAAAAPPPLQLVSGETLPYLGYEHYLEIQRCAFPAPEIELGDGKICVRMPHDVSHDVLDESRYELTRFAIVEWYKAQAEGFVSDKVTEWLRKMLEVAGKGFGGGDRVDKVIEWLGTVPESWEGYPPNPRVLIGDQRRRWGSCARNGTLRFNWRLMMLEQTLVDYVVVHELAHLKVRDHSGNFWRQVSQVMSYYGYPDYRYLRRLLREAEKRGFPL